MNTPQHIHAHTPTQRTDNALFMRRRDPILEEVYSVKAKLNAEANYSVEKILERSRQTSASFDLR